MNYRRVVLNTVGGPEVMHIVEEDVPDRAHRLVESASVQGKLVLMPNP